MHSFYIEPPAGGVSVLAPEEAKHALKVLRLNRGDEICALDGRGGRWRGEIAGVDGGTVQIHLLEALSDNEATMRLTVYEGLPKGDKLDLIVQKLTELGAAALVPVQMERCVVRLDGKDAAKRRERLEKIAREAVKQCGRSKPLHVALPMSFRQALIAMARHEVLLIPWEDAREMRFRDVWKENPGARDIGIVIGPEGGIPASEVDAMTALGGQIVTMGPRILRTETAAVVSAALAMQLWGDI